MAIRTCPATGSASAPPAGTTLIRSVHNTTAKRSHAKRGERSDGDIRVDARQGEGARHKTPRPVGPDRRTGGRAPHTTVRSHGSPHGPWGPNRSVAGTP